MSLPDSDLERWRYALKPASWPKLLVPAILGQALGVSISGGFSLLAALFGALYTVADLVFIVLLNDWGDREVDALKRRMFPDGCSPKTIPDGILGADQVRDAGLGAGCFAAAIALAGGKALGLPWLGVCGVAALGIFIAYTLPPLRLNYRGGGELLEMLGVGLALPWLNAYAQSGAAWAPQMLVLLPFCALSLASALASGLADEESDRLGGKRTFATRHGNNRTRRVCEALVFVGATGWVALAALCPAATSLWGAIAAAFVAVVYLDRMLDLSDAATTGAFAAQKRYKGALHLAIWLSALIMAFVALLRA